jgi:hypothetical protein
MVAASAALDARRWGSAFLDDRKHLADQGTRSIPRATRAQGNSYAAALNWPGLSGIGLLHFVALPTGLRLVLAFLLLDCADYAFHRLSHRSRVLWLLHSVHHSDTAVDVSTNLRHHPANVSILSMAVRRSSSAEHRNQWREIALRDYVTGGNRALGASVQFGGTRGSRVLHIERCG